MYAVASIISFIATVRAARAEARKIRATRLALMDLHRDDLRDIGVSRHAIAEVAVACVRR